ncbi:hypothetical protein Poli38472_000639 [Pythium oligandrum]|uniref:RRM domain-containing protein n=1 Tax=Pythium oligandrum TaxID=41045 RepID=A0A8K1CE56_PYTOL|nr:hypothetical protein Poli38472_000639 [Pythium oligandrum]|eukprot:TMW60597.1 hypothetical protein Poli38472_000639 [Pythium oligandrum]
MAATSNAKRNLYVGGLDRQVTEEVLYAAFVPFGAIKQVQIPTDFAARNAAPGKRHGFVEFEDADDARAAIDNMDESELFGKTLRVTIAKPERAKLGSKKPVWAEIDESKEAITPEDANDDVEMT